MYREAGVGFAVGSNILNKLEVLPVPINKRLMTTILPEGCVCGGVLL